MAEQDDKEKRVPQFLDLNAKSTRGRLKIYIGMSAGVGKSYLMLQEASTCGVFDAGVIKYGPRY